MCDRWFDAVPLVVVEPGIRTGVPVLYDNPKEVGADRIVNTLAAFTLHGGPAIVVDFGTSTNFDVVSAKGEFLGGVLAPGIEISVDALASRAAQLMKVQLVRPRSVIGKNTVESLAVGNHLRVRLAGRRDHRADHRRTRDTGHGDCHRRPRDCGARGMPAHRRPRAVADPDRVAVDVRTQYRMRSPACQIAFRP